MNPNEEFFARIDLSKTNYSPYKFSKVIEDPDPKVLQRIYRDYCRHHNFKSVMPIFDCEFFDNEIVGYYADDVLVAWSMIGIYDDENCECYQFCWDYADPNLHIGMKSLRNECAIYKARGFKYLYLGHPAEYKSQIDGYELTGSIDELYKT